MALPAEMRTMVGPAVPLRVLLVDGAALFRAGVAMLLQSDARVGSVAQAGSTAEAVEQTGRFEPDVVLMDLTLSGGDGIAATQAVLQVRPEAKVIVLTSSGDDRVVAALRAGAAGYMLKESSWQAIMAAIVAVAAGERVVSGPVLDSMLEIASTPNASHEQFDGLSERQLDILKLLAGGLANKQIAARLGISEKTVRNRVSNLYETLKIADRTQAVLYGVRKGLVSP